jgi:hypothetical protein
MAFSFGSAPATNTTPTFGTGSFGGGAAQSATNLFGSASFGTQQQQQQQPAFGAQQQQPMFGTQQQQQTFGLPPSSASVPPAAADIQAREKHLWDRLVQADGLKSNAAAAAFWANPEAISAHQEICRLNFAYVLANPKAGTPLKYFGPPVTKEDK